MQQGVPIIRIRIFQGQVVCLCFEKVNSQKYLTCQLSAIRHIFIIPVFWAMKKIPRFHRRGCKWRINAMQMTRMLFFFFSFTFPLNMSTQPYKLASVLAGHDQDVIVTSITAILLTLH